MAHKSKRECYLQVMVFVVQSWNQFVRTLCRKKLNSVGDLLETAPRHRRIKLQKMLLSQVSQGGLVKMPATVDLGRNVINFFLVSIFTYI